MFCNLTLTVTRYLFTIGRLHLGITVLQSFIDASAFHLLSCAQSLRTLGVKAVIGRAVDLNGRI